MTLFIDGMLEDFLEFRVFGVPWLSDMLPLVDGKLQVMDATVRGVLDFALVFVVKEAAVADMPESEATSMDECKLLLVLTFAARLRGNLLLAGFLTIVKPDPSWSKAIESFSDTICACSLFIFSAYSTCNLVKSDCICLSCDLSE